MADFGLDFGTTNSLAAIVDGGRVTSLLGADDRPHPSVVWYHGPTRIVGREAKSQIEKPTVGVVGDVVRSPKSYLGSGEKIHVAGRAIAPSEVVAEILAYVRKDARARKLRGHEFDQAVFTIPVNMPGRGRQELREAAMRAGIRITQFVHEPLAALYGHLRAQDNYERQLAELRNQVVLVFDWGGGTLDLTLCQFLGRTLVQIQSVGNREVGGDRFDEQLMRWVADQHFAKHSLRAWPGETEGAKSRLLEQCERAKIDLSTRDSVTLLVDNYLAVDGPARHLDVRITRPDLEKLTQHTVMAGLATIDDLLRSAGQQELGLSFCLATGGMVQMPCIREHLVERFGVGRFKSASRGDETIAQGAAWIAHDHLRLRLAKSFEFLDADNSYVPIIHNGTKLPLESEVQRYSMSVYCVDPRDGMAKLQLARPKRPSRVQPADPRQVYTTLTVQVDPKAKPLVERIAVDLSIDHNLIVSVNVRSTIREDGVSAEVHDLEFGLELEVEDEDEERGKKPEGEATRSPHVTRRAANPGAVAIRSNVTKGQGRKGLIPGELIAWEPGIAIPTRQEEEHKYYKRCFHCGRTVYEIQTHGCTWQECPESAHLRTPLQNPSERRADASQPGLGPGDPAGRV